jgi:hypothetical protein
LLSCSSQSTSSVVSNPGEQLQKDTHCVKLLLHSIALSITQRAYVCLLALSAITLHAAVLRYVFCPILIPPQSPQQSAPSAPLAHSVTQPSLPHSTITGSQHCVLVKTILYNII